MLLHVCDLCKKNRPTTEIKYKAKRLFVIPSDIWYKPIWEKIELCDTCLNKIIQAKEEDNNA